MEWNLQTVIEESLTGLRFGSVEIVVHDGRITQIERRERFRAFHEKPILDFPTPEKKQTQQHS